jgi:hypothetical protein
MINSNEQEDRKAARKKQEERARAVSAARKHAGGRFDGPLSGNLQ